MARRITCPNCHETLRIADGVEDRWLTCPRCLASVPNPDRTDAIARAPNAAGTGPEPAPVPRSCPGCGNDVEAAWRHCPFCDTSLRPTGRAPRTRSATAEAQLDLGWIGYGLIALGLLGMFSLIALPVLGRVSPSAEAVVVIGGGILLMVLAGIGLGLASQKPSVRTSVSITGAIAVLLIILALLPLALCMGIMRGCEQARPDSGQRPR